MKILWWSVASPFAPTAYGKVTRQMSLDLMAQGHEVHILPISGLRWGELNMGGVHIHGHPPTDMTPRTLIEVYRDLNCDVCVYMGDVWPYVSELTEVARAVPLVLHSPVDHAPLGGMESYPGEVQALQGVLAALIPSRWGVEVCAQSGIMASYVPHGVDLNVYKPLEGDRAELRRSLGWDPEAFIFLMVGTNKGDRKNIPLVLRALSELPPNDINGRPVHLALHTYWIRDRSNPSGIYLDLLADSMGIMDRIYWTDLERASNGLPEAEMAKLYQAADVLLMPSKTEGFGIPIIEAGACGIPAIVTDYSAMAELVDWDRGWKVRVDALELEQALDMVWMAAPALYGHHGLLDIMQLAIDTSDHDRRVKRRNARRFAEGYTWTAAAQMMEAELIKALASTTKAPEDAAMEVGATD